MGSSEVSWGSCLDRALERASRADRVPVALQRLMSTLHARRRRTVASGGNPEERELAGLLSAVFQGDAAACRRAAELARRLVKG